MYPGAYVDIQGPNNELGIPTFSIKRAIFLSECPCADGSKQYLVIRHSKKLGFEPISVPGTIKLSKLQKGDVFIFSGRPSEKFICQGKESCGCCWSATPIGNPDIYTKVTPDDIAIVMMSSESKGFSGRQTKVLIGHNKVSGWLRGIDEDGLIVEFEEAVGQHSYDGQFKARHCSIVPPRDVFVDIREIADEDKQNGSEDS